MCSISLTIITLSSVKVFRVFYLVYVSSATRRMSHDELVALLHNIRANNERLGVTGLLLYHDGSFMQMLEGEKQTVLDLYEKIQEDERHSTVLLMLSDDIEQRNFDDWSMGFFNMDKVDGFPGYDEFVSENITLRSFRPDSQDAYEFMMTFNRLN